MVHPEHDCEDCGKTHFAWSLHKDWADKNRRTRNVLIVIAVIVAAAMCVTMMMLLILLMLLASVHQSCLFSNSATNLSGH